MSPPPHGRVVLALHGTRSQEGQGVCEELARLVGERTQRPATAAYVDVVGPSLGEVAEASDVVVPVFLGHGYHVRVDVARVGREVGCRITPPLIEGTDVPVELVDALRARLAEVGGPSGPVVLGWAGSSAQTSRAQVAAVAQSLSRAWGVPVHPATPSEVAAVVAGLGPGVTVASHLLAPGHFADRLRTEAGVPTSAPIGTHPRLVDLIVHRVASAISPGLSGNSSAQPYPA